MKLKSRFWILSAFALAATNPLANAETSYFYGGDKTPAESPYDAWFTALGPGHPSGGYFTGATWGSDGDVLSMNTLNPIHNPGSPSIGIWFGRTDNYGDPSVGLSFSPSVNGNRVEGRFALGANSGEWSMYWLDANYNYSNFYFLENGFHCYAAGNDIFVPVPDMTSFHTYSSHIVNGQISYYFDGALVAEGAANVGGIANFLLIGDGSATDVSGYGSLLVDSVNIVVDAGAAPASVPEPTTCGLLGLGALLGGAAWRRQRK